MAKSIMADVLKNLLSGGKPLTIASLAVWNDGKALELDKAPPKGVQDNGVEVLGFLKLGELSSDRKASSPMIHIFLSIESLGALQASTADLKLQTQKVYLILTQYEKKDELKPYARDVCYPMSSVRYEQFTFYNEALNSNKPYGVMSASVMNIISEATFGDTTKTAGKYISNSTIQEPKEA